MVLRCQVTLDGLPIPAVLQRSCRPQIPGDARQPLPEAAPALGTFGTGVKTAAS